MLLNNPEFKRNLWLELSVHRLIAAPILLAMIFFAAVQAEHGWVNISRIASYIFIVTTLLWGTHLAFDAVSDEVRNKTWDSLRMSALSPFNMVWGKLFGATAFAWYIGLPCLLIILLLNDSEFAKQGSVSLIITLFLAALLAHAFAFLCVLSTVKANTGAPKAVSMIIFFVILAAVISAYNINYALYQVWFGINVNRNSFLMLSLAIFTGWAWLGCYRNMQSALQIKITPWAMPIFVLFAALYLLGFYDAGANALTLSNWLNLGATLVTGIAFYAVYFGAFTERRDLVSIRRFLNAWRAQKIMSALKETPYFIALIALLLVAIPLMMLSNAPAYIGSQGSLQLIMSVRSLGAVGFVGFVLMLRDIGLLYYFSLGNEPQRAAMTTLFYLLMLCVVLPMLLPNSLAIIIAPQHWFLASIHGFMLGLAIAAAHLAAVVFLLYRQNKVFSTQAALL